MNLTTSSLSPLGKDLLIKIRDEPVLIIVFYELTNLFVPLTLGIGVGLRCRWLEGVDLRW